MTQTPQTQQPRVRFAPLAWLKLIYLCRKAETEVGLLGLTAEHDHLYVEDLYVPKQSCTAVSTRFDSEDLLDLQERLGIGQGLSCSRFLRVWIHTHPGHSAQPSGKDEETFAQQFADASWALMFILARDGQTYCRIRIGWPPDPVSVIEVPFDWTTDVDWGRFPADVDATSLDALQETWSQELAERVKTEAIAYSSYLIDTDSFWSKSGAGRDREEPVGLPADICRICRTETVAASEPAQDILWCARCLREADARSLSEVEQICETWQEYFAWRQDRQYESLFDTCDECGKWFPLSELRKQGSTDPHYAFYTCETCHRDTRKPTERKEQ